MAVLAGCTPAVQETVVETVLVTQQVTITKPVKTVLITATPVPPTDTPEPTPTLTIEQELAQFKESETFQEGLQDYLNAMGLERENVEIREETIELNGQQYSMLVAVSDTSKLNETQQKYADIYQPVPLFIYAENRQTGEWEWMAEPPLRLFAQEIGLQIGNNEWFTNSKAKVDKLKHFNSCTISEPFLWSNWEPQQGKVSPRYKREANELVNTALENEMEILGHPIIWSYMTPDWLKEGNFSQEELEEIVRAHVHSVMEPYKEQIKYWNVVNEFHPIAVQGGYEEDYLYSKLGSHYVEIAFEEARKTDPNAILIYNDGASYAKYATWFNQTYNTVKQLKKLGLIDAVGMQLHLNMPGWTDIPSPKQFSEAIKAFQDLGVEVYVTELDVAIDPNAKSPSQIFPEQTRFFDQGQVYYDVLQTYLEADAGNVFTLWGLYDNESWLEQMLNMPNADALLFDENNNPKPAFYALLQVLYSAALANSQ